MSNIMSAAEAKVLVLRTPTAELVCQGACNKDFTAVVDEVLTFRASAPTAEDATMPKVPDALAERLRLLKHTKHAEAKPFVFKCLQCGSVRMYGWV